MLAAKLIEFNEFLGSQYRLYKKLMIKFEKSIGGDGDQVEPVVFRLTLFHIACLPDSGGSASQHALRARCLWRPRDHPQRRLPLPPQDLFRHTSRPHSYLTPLKPH